MKKWLAIFLLFGIFFSLPSLAVPLKYSTVAACPYPNPSIPNAPTACFVMLTVPSTGPVNYPVYVFTQNPDGSQTQYGVYFFSGQQFFLAQYSATLTQTYNLYYQDNNKTWRGCTLSLTNGQLTGGTCPGATFSLDPATASGTAQGVYNLSMGAQVWPRAKVAPTVIPPTYQPRTITFTNKTKYPTIWLTESCTQQVSPFCPNVASACQNTTTAIQQGQPYVLTIDQNGLCSANFYISAYQDGSQQISTGGSGSAAYATLFETTTYPLTLAPNTNPPTPGYPVAGVTPVVGIGTATYDVSAATGFNFGMTVYPATPQYCTLTIGGENTQALGAGYYNEQNPLNSLVPTTGLSFEDLCKKSSQNPPGTSSDAWDLSVVDNAGKFFGCYSLCQYATVNNIGNADQYCCTGNYNQPSTCTAPPASSYVINLANNSQHIYSFPYNDYVGTQTCSGLTNVNVDISGTAVPASQNTIKFNVTPTATPTASGASIAWAPAQDSDSTATITYLISMTQQSDNAPVPTSDITVNQQNNTAIVTGLSPTTAYQFTVSASDSSGASANSNPAGFTTLTPVYTLSAPTNVQANPALITQSSAVVSWTAVQDNSPNPQLTYSLDVTPPPSGSDYSTVTTSEQLVNLTPNTQYSVTVSAVDPTTSNSPQTAPAIQFTTQAVPPPPSNNITPPGTPVFTSGAHETGLITFTLASVGQTALVPGDNAVYTVTATPTNNPTAPVLNGFHLAQVGNNQWQARVRAVQSSVSYSIVVAVTYQNQVAESQPGTIPAS